MARQFVELLRRNAKELQSLEGDHAAEFLRLLKALREDVLHRIASRGGMDDTIDAFRIKLVAAETQAAISELEHKAQGVYATAAEAATELSITHIADEVDSLSLAFDSAPLDVTLDAAKALSDPGQLLLANHYETSVARYGLEALNGVRQKLFVGLRSGDSLRTVSNAIAGQQGPFGVVGKANGERLARTEISQAYGAAQHSGLTQAAKQVPALKKVWIHVGSYICDVCMPLHGTERPLDGTWTIRQGKRTKQVSHAPAHPHCGCRVSGMKSSWRDALKDLGYLDQKGEDASPEKL